MARIPWYINSRPYTFDGGGEMNNDNGEASTPTSPYLPPVSFHRFFEAALNMRRRLPEDKKKDWQKIAAEAAKKRGVLSKDKNPFGGTEYWSNRLPEVTVTAKAPDDINPFAFGIYRNKFHPSFGNDEELLNEAYENFLKLIFEKMRQRRAKIHKTISEDYMRQPIKSVAPSIGDDVDIFSGFDIR